jgi:hypothetical protein
MPQRRKPWPASPRLVLTALAAAAGLGVALQWAGLPGASFAFGHSRDSTTAVSSVDGAGSHQPRSQERRAPSAASSRVVPVRRASLAGTGSAWRMRGDHGSQPRIRRPSPAPSGQPSAPSSADSTPGGPGPSATNAVQQQSPPPPPPSPLPQVQLPEVSVPQLPQVTVPQVPTLPIPTPSVPTVQVPALPTP